ncbi:MAG: hypothetical protein AB1765_08530 [Candidatus Hydrogenedentota bacterium]
MKAIAVVSGGLDSMLSAKLIMNQGIEVTGVHLLIPFSKYANENIYREKVKELGKNLGIEIIALSTGIDYLELIKKPRYGYGKNINPCIDCHIYMFKRAKKLMEEIDAKFIITGEVLGQRPMSQNKATLELIEKRSELQGLIVRPLSAKALKETIPEKEGRIDREKLLGIVGKSRKIQLEKARELGLQGYGTPAGGCLLTDPGFARRVQDLIKSDMLTLDTIDLIKNGRYFALSDKFKLIVARDYNENINLKSLAKERYLVIESISKGPDAIGIGDINDERIKQSVEIVAYYCKKEKEHARIKYGIYPETGKYEMSINRNEIKIDLQKGAV